MNIILKKQKSKSPDFNNKELVMNKIKEMRTSGKTIQEIADICQTSWFNVQKWLKGAPMSELSVKVICRIFDDLSKK